MRPQIKDEFNKTVNASIINMILKKSNFNWRIEDQTSLTKVFKFFTKLDLQIWNELIIFKVICGQYGFRLKKEEWGLLCVLQQVFPFYFEKYFGSRKYQKVTKAFFVFNPNLELSYEFDILEDLIEIHPDSLWKLIRSKYLMISPSCVICNKNIGIEIHHIIPQAFGGTHEISNLTSLCASCHLQVHSPDENNEWPDTVINMKDQYISNFEKFVK